MLSYTDASTQQLTHGLMAKHGQAEDRSRNDRAITSRRDPI